MRLTIAPRRSHAVTVFKYLLVLRNGRPADPAVFLTPVRTWGLGERLIVNTGQQFRIVGISRDTDELNELHARGINGMWVVEPVA